MNRYSYVRFNPLKYTDPSGHGPCPPTGPCDPVPDPWQPPWWAPLAVHAERIIRKGNNTVGELGRQLFEDDAFDSSLLTFSYGGNPIFEGFEYKYDTRYLTYEGKMQIKIRGDFGGSDIARTSRKGMSVKLDEISRLKSSRDTTGLVVRGSPPNPRKFGPGSLAVQPKGEIGFASSGMNIKLITGLSADISYQIPTSTTHFTPHTIINMKQETTFRSSRALRDLLIIATIYAAYKLLPVMGPVPIIREAIQPLAP